MNRKAIIFALISILFSSISYSQNFSVFTTLDEVVRFLDKNSSDSIKKIIKASELKEIEDFFDYYSGEEMTNWEYLDDEFPLAAFFIAKGVNFIPHMQAIMLQALHLYLNEDKINEHDLIKTFMKIEKKWAKEDDKRFNSSMLRGVYIPEKLDDCFKQIDVFWNDSVRNAVKNMDELEFVSMAHFSFGMWIRNNWQLWGGSRLSKYFNNMGIYHPDDMSSIIIISYHRYLNNVPIELEDQLQYYYTYWEEVKKREQGTNDEAIATKNKLDSLGVRLNDLFKVDPRKIIYFKDSFPIVHERKGDSLFYWTAGMSGPLAIDKMDDLINSAEFGKTSFFSAIYPDGRPELEKLSKNTYILKNDTLFKTSGYYTISKDSQNILRNLAWSALVEKDTVVDFPGINASSSEYETYMTKKYTAESRIELAKCIQILAANYVSTLNPMFCCTFFNDGKNKYVINPEDSCSDEIELIAHWKHEDHYYYSFLVRNKCDETKGGYTIDENFNFYSFGGYHHPLMDSQKNSKSLLNNVYCKMK